MPYFYGEMFALTTIAHRWEFGKQPLFVFYEYILFNHVFLFTFYFLFISGYMMVRGNPAGVSSFLTPCGGYWVSIQAHLSIEPSLPPPGNIFQFFTVTSHVLPNKLLISTTLFPLLFKGWKKGLDILSTVDFRTLWFEDHGKHMKSENLLQSVQCLIL